MRDAGASSVARMLLIASAVQKGDAGATQAQQSLRLRESARVQRPRRADALGLNQFGDLAHRRWSVTEQEIGDAVLIPTGLERKGIARGEAMIEHET